MNNELQNTDTQQETLMKEINQGVRNIRQVDWVTFLSDLVKAFRMLKQPVSSIGWVWALISEIDEPTKRMDLLALWQDAAPKFLPIEEERNEFIANCDCLVHINSRLRSLYIQNAQLPHTYDDEWGGKGLNELAMIWADNYVTGYDMVALASGIHQSVITGVKPPLIEQILLSSRNCNYLAFDNIYDFSRNLFLAECFRKFLIDGKANSDAPMTFGKFKRKIRNACFDAYIQLRIDQIKEETEYDNWILVDPERDEDYYPMLYKVENMVLDREKQFETFKGSQAYHDRWFNGRPDVLNMMQYFIDYLNWKIEHSNNKNMQTNTHTNIINGDYVAGNKITGDVFENVEAGGIGKQIVYGRQPESDAKPSEPAQQTPTAAQTSNEDLFKYIHYEVTDDDERLHIHKSVCNIVRLPKMQQICKALAELKKDNKILSSVDQSAMLAELRRLGMPADQQGFSDQNFYSFYTK